jgi:hypothetical protein
LKFYTQYKRYNLVIILVCFLIHSIVVPPVFADKENNLKDQGRSEKNSTEEMEAEDKRDKEEEREEKIGEAKEEKEEKEKEREGDDFTGDVAAVLFGVGNANVLFGMVLRALSRSTLIGMKLKDTISALNRYQQKLLRRCHYILNPLAAATVSLHWYLSYCGVLTFQQWGTALAILLVISGLIIKYRLAPQSLRLRLFQIHTSPFMLLTVVSLVVLGHIFTDD